MALSVMVGFIAITIIVIISMAYISYEHTEYDGPHTDACREQGNHSDYYAIYKLSPYQLTDGYIWQCKISFIADNGYPGWYAWPLEEAGE